MAAMAVPLVVATELPQSSLRSSLAAQSPGTPAELLASLPCLANGQFCPPPPALMRLVANDLPVDSVLAIDINEEYQPTLFVPQRMVAWPGPAQGLIPRAIFVRYFESYDRSTAACGDQPLFNACEARADRLAFVRNLSVTHVLVNPRFHALMTGVLAQDPEVFTPRYDDGRWALYEVSPAFRSLRL